MQPNFILKKCTSLFRCCLVFLFLFDVLSFLIFAFSGRLWQCLSVFIGTAFMLGTTYWQVWIPPVDDVAASQHECGHFKALEGQIWTDANCPDVFNAQTWDGTRPLKLLLVRESVLNVLSLPNSVGIVPESALPSAKKTFSLVIIPSCVGSFPVRSLFDRSRYVSLDNLTICVGTVPPNPRFFNTKFFNAAKLPSCVGIVPSTGPVNTKLVNWLNNPNCVGIVPIKENSKESKLGNIPGNTAPNAAEILKVPLGWIEYCPRAAQDLQIVGVGVQAHGAQVVWEFAQEVG